MDSYTLHYTGWYFFVFIFMNTCQQGFGQQVLTFETYPTQKHKAFDNLPPEASVFRLSSWPDISAEIHSLTLNLGKEFKWEFELTSVDLIADTYTLRSVDKGKNQLYLPFNEPQFYLGHIKGNPDSKVTVMIIDQQIEASIITKDSRLHIEQLDKFQKDTKGLVVYDANLQTGKQSMICSHSKVENIVSELNSELKSTGSCAEIELAIALDYTYLLEHSSSLEQAVNQSLNVMLMATSDYAGQFAKDISFSIVEHVVSTCENCDPWTPNPDAEVLLDDFTQWARAGGFTQSHDIGQLWTGRNLHKDQSYATVGFAHANGVCSPEKYHVLEDNNLGNWQRRVLCSHEIAHNLNCSHDATDSQTIMSPFLTNSTQWSASSINTINTILNQSTCLSSCSTQICDSFTSISIDGFDENNLKFSWNSGPLEEVRITLENLSLNTHLLDTIVQANSYHYVQGLSHCTNLKLEISTMCNPDYKLSKLLSTSVENRINIKNVAVSNCQPGNYSRYDLALNVDHDLSDGTMVFIEVDGVLSTHIINQSTTTIHLTGLESTWQKEKEIVMYQIINGSRACESTARFTTPTITCDLYYSETFNDCVVPDDWFKTSTNKDYFPYPFEWSVGGSSRKIENYAKQTNAYSSLSLDGSCMAYFDDDINSNIGYTGVIELYSPVFDISNFYNVNLGFDYLFHGFTDAKGPNSSLFKCEVWNGSTWVILLLDNTTDCPWSNVWSSDCVGNISASVDSYKNNQFQVKFSYTDGSTGDWTGMVALDNFLLTGENTVIYGCNDPNALNYDPSAQIDDDSCYSCHNNIMDGEETGIDCGGIVCAPCPQNCHQDSVIVNSVKANTTYSNAKIIEAVSLIDVEGVSFMPGESMIMSKGFELTKGKSLSIEIVACNK